MALSPHPHPSTPPDIALAALRRATGVQHARIESLLGLGGPFGRRHYGQVLQGFGVFLQGWEPLIARALPAGLQDWFGEGRRAHLVQRDLRHLGLPGLAPAMASLPAVHGPSQALGSLYVMEGSALGGQLISAGLRRRLGIEAHNGGAYFHGCGAGTAARWRSYRDRAERALQGDAAARADATDAAVRTFDALIATFRGVLDERAAA